MTRAALDSVRLPSDGSNTGKYTATRKRTVSGTEYHSAVVSVESRERVTGVYRAAMALQSVAASAQNATSTGFLWITLPAATTTRAVRIRQCELSVNHSASTTMPTNPRIGLARFTFTGTASGATLAGAKIDPDYDQPTADLRTAVTGMTVTLNTDPGSLLSTVNVPAMHNVTAAGLLFAPSILQYLVPVGALEDEWPLIKGGQGLVVYQLDNGTTTDTRRFTLNLLWDEIEL